MCSKIVQNHDMIGHGLRGFLSFNKCYNIQAVNPQIARYGQIFSSKHGSWTYRHRIALCALPPSRCWVLCASESAVLGRLARICLITQDRCGTPLCVAAKVQSTGGCCRTQNLYFYTYQCSPDVSVIAHCCKLSVTSPLSSILILPTPDNTQSFVHLLPLMSRELLQLRPRPSRVAQAKSAHKSAYPNASLQ